MNFDKEDIDCMNWEVKCRICGSREVFGRAMGMWSHPLIAEVLEVTGLLTMV